MPTIRTARLDLVGASVAMLQAEIADRARFGKLLDAMVPSDWPPQNNDETTMRYLLELLESDSANDGWNCFYNVWRDSPRGRLLIGNCGFKGKADARGVVEIGYAFLADYQKWGFGAEMVAGLVGYAFSHHAVQTMVAETFPTLIGSIRILERNGFQPIGPGSEEGAIRFALSR